MGKLTLNLHSTNIRSMKLQFVIGASLLALAYSSPVPDFNSLIGAFSGVVEQTAGDVGNRVDSLSKNYGVKNGIKKEIAEAEKYFKGNEGKKTLKKVTDLAQKYGSKYLNLNNLGGIFGQQVKQANTAFESASKFTQEKKNKPCGRVYKRELIKLREQIKKSVTDEDTKTQLVEMINQVRIEGVAQLKAAGLRGEKCANLGQKGLDSLADKVQNGLESTGFGVDKIKGMIASSKNQFLDNFTADKINKFTNEVQ